MCNHVLSFFSKLKFLESVLLMERRYDPLDRKIRHSSGDMILFLLEHCPTLRRLHYNLSRFNHIQINDTLLEKLASSRIKDFRLVCGNFSFDPKILQCQAWPFNYNLSRFGIIHNTVSNYSNIFSPEYQQIYPAVLLKLFPNLKEVELSRVTEQGLLAVWNYKVRLPGSNLYISCSVVIEY